MGSPLREIIQSCENSWQDRLYSHCKRLFSGLFLPSHDHLHHARVWSHARTLLLLLDESGVLIPDSLPEKLIIAVFFHDVGLTRTPGEMHGQESRRLCEEFFSGPGSDIPKTQHGKFEEILFAIEHHDDKSLKSCEEKILPGKPADLLSLLSASDDLDAFGILGIYRYAEIYLLRGTVPEQLPSPVLKNLDDRFGNLRNCFGFAGEFIRKQEKRFQVTRNFYLQLAMAYASQEERPSWEPVLIEIFRKSLEQDGNLLKTDRLLPGTEFDTEIRNWFGLLDLELDSSALPG